MTKVKILKTGNFLKVDAVSHDVVIMDTKLKEVSRIKGDPLFESWTAHALHYAKRSASDYSCEEDIIVWMDGNYTFSFLDVNNMQHTRIPGFWTLETGQQAFGCATVASFDLRKVAGIGICDTFQTIHVFDGAASVSYYKNKPLSQLCKSRPV